MVTTDNTSADNVLTQRVARRRLFAGITPSSRLYWLRLLAENPAAVVSAGFLLVVVVLAIIAPVLTPYDPTFLDPGVRLQEPSADHWFGTDEVGRDVFTRILFGARISLLVGTAVMLVAAFVGSVLGLIAGYYDRLDMPIMRVMDGLMAFPGILLAIAIMASLGQSTVNVVIALVVVYVPIVSRLVRSTTLTNKQAMYVESARAVGLKDRTILRRYIFPNSLSPLIVQCTFIIAYAIISEASLSFLGAGVPPETPTWGNMLKEGQQLLQRAWWQATFAGIALFLLVLALNLLGDGLRDALDPRSRER